MRRDILTEAAMSSAKKARPLSRDAIKYIAMFTMLLNHIGNIFLPYGSVLWLIFINIGYFTAITMCYFLVEGYGYTRSRKRYALRLGLFALLSQLPYELAFSTGHSLRFTGMNMLFTLLLCFFIVLALDNLKGPALKILSVAGLTLLSLFSDWGMFAPMFTVLFVWAGGDSRRVKLSYLISALFFGLYQFMSFSARLPDSKNLVNALGGMAAIALSGLCITYLYNGQRSYHGQALSKWFFYVFYPAHLLILGLIRVL